MDGEMQVCPNCGAAIEPGDRFCPSCGTKVEECAVQHTPPALRATSPNLGEELRGSSPETGEVAAGRRGMTSMTSAPFELSAALPEAMQVGRRSLVMVRFRAKEDIYEAVEFVLRNGEEELARRVCCPGRPLTSEHQVSLDVIPKTCGSARVALDVVCRVGTGCDVEVHTSILQIAVDDSGKSDAFNPIFNISQMQNSDRAGDSKGGDINVNLGGIKLHQELDSTRYETPTSFTPIRTELRMSPARLTLNGGSSVLQLVSDDVVTFGRSRGNVIPLRAFGPDGILDEDASVGISRFHFRIGRTDRGLMIMDGGFPDGTASADGNAAPSAYGTRVEGAKLPPAGACKVASGRNVPFAVGRKDVELKMRLRAFCDRQGRSAGAIIDREDGARMRVCVAWRDVPLTDAETISWSGCRWSLNSDKTPLFVGAVISIGGASFEVQPFHHTHLN